MVGTGPVGKRQSQQGREMVSYLRADDLPTAEQQPKHVPGLEARLRGRGVDGVRAVSGGLNGAAASLTSKPHLGLFSPSLGTPRHHERSALRSRNSHVVDAAREVGHQVTHQPDTTPQPNETNAPSKLPPWALACPP